jgi:2-polyprenyl-3-methyl-5-hydroxy-6-metoxy-1,4-benzoquinol methylase
MPLVNCVICNSECSFLFSKEDWNEKFSFFKCTKCTHVFVFPPPSAQSLDEFYNQEYYVPDFQKLKVRKKGEYCLPYLTVKDKPLLEIGCSYGYFLELMQEKNINVDGLELSKIASQSARTKGFSVICGGISDLPETQKFQGIFMFDVLEHIINPQEFFMFLQEKLDSKGELFLTVPNQGSLEFKLLNKYWEWASPPAHLHYFNQKSITSLLESNGFSEIVITSFKGDSAGNLFFHFYDAFKRMVLFNIGFLIYGKKRFLEKKKNYNLSQKDNRQHQEKEFQGITYFIYQITKIFTPIDWLLRSKLNQPTLFIKGIKK